MPASRRTQQVTRAFREAQRVELVEHERSFLLPVLSGQLKYVGECIEKVKAIAENPRTVREISFPLSQVLPEPRGDADADARKYLGTVAAQCQTDFLTPIAELLRAKDEVHDVASLGSWLGKVQTFCSSIARNTKVLFWNNHQGFVAVRDASGQIVTGPPHQLQSIVYPFDTIIAEAARVAEAIDTNVDNWAANLKDSTKRLLEFSTAENQAQSAKWTSWAQIAATLGSLVLVLLGVLIGDWYSRRLNTAELRAENQALMSERAGLQQENAELRKRLEALPASPPTPQPLLPAQPTPGKTPTPRKHL